MDKKISNTKSVLMLVTRGEIGGAQIFLETLARELHANGHAVLVGIGKAQADNDTYLAKALAIHGIQTHEFKHLRRSFSPLRNIAFVFELRSFLKKHPHKALHINSSNALYGALGAKLLPKKLRPRTIHTHHGLSYIDPNSKKTLASILMRVALWVLLPFVDKNVFVSEQNHKDALRLGIAKNASVIENAVNIEYASREEARKVLSEKINKDTCDAFVVGSIGRLAYPKNYELLIESAQEIISQKPHALFIIIGDGPERKKYEDLIKQNGLENKFFLPGSIENAGQYVTAFDVFVLTSLYEGSPLTLLEAQGANIPCVFENTTKENLVKKIISANTNPSPILSSIKTMAEKYEQELKKI